MQEISDHFAKNKRAPSPNSRAKQSIESASNFDYLGSSVLSQTNSRFPNNKLTNPTNFEKPKLGNGVSIPNELKK